MFHTNTKNGITYLTADTLDGVCHGFSTRPGGVSPAPWDSLNLGVGRGDDLERVRKNYRRFCAVLGTDVQAVFNSGVLLMDLEAGRREIQPQAIFRYAQEHAKELVLPDQDILNALYASRILALDDYVWNYDARNYNTYLLRSAGIAVAAELGAQLCRDAGESALAAVVETAGAVCALLTALPLLRAVLDMLLELMG